MPFVAPTLSDEELDALQPISLEQRRKDGPPNAVMDDFGNKVDGSRIVPVPGVDNVTAEEWFGMNATQRKALMNKGRENQWGNIPLIGRPIAQFINATSSPGFTEGAIIGPINAVSKLGNALGDVILRQEIDTSDAWTISDEQAASVNPERYSINRNDPWQRDTPADAAGRPLGRVFGAEVLGAVTTLGVGNVLRRIPQVASAANAVRNSVQARRLAFAARRSPELSRGLNAATTVAEGVASTTAAAFYMDPLLEGNVLNSVDDVVIDPTNRGGVPFVRGVRDDETGIRLPGRVDAENQNYFEALQQQVLVDGVLFPLTLLGGLATVKPLRNLAISGDTPKFLNEIAEAELAPYAPSSQPLLAPAPAADVVPDGARTLAPAPETIAELKARYGDDPAGWPEVLDRPAAPTAVPVEDSAISRAQSANRQVQQVEAQRTRLEQMGLQNRTFDGQYELTFPSNVSPDVARQIKALQRQRYELIKANSGPNVSPEVVKQSDQLEAQIQALMASGEEMIPGLEIPLREAVQYSDAPDPRPELSTYLAELDELSDAQLREMLPRVSSEEKLAQRQQALKATEQRVSELEQQLIEIQTRAALPEGSKKRLTATGAKRKTNKIQAELAAAKDEMGRLEAEPVTPVLVGDQLDLELNGGQQQIEFPEAPREPNTFDRIEQMVAEGSELLVDMEWDEQLGLYRKVGGQVEEVVDEAVEAYPSGYASPEAYKDYLMGWPRDLLRKMNAPKEISGSGDIAAILKARTGRRVWSAKKEDIVDAMVEYGKRLGKWVEPPPPPARPVEFAQQPLELQQTMNLSDGLSVADSPSFGSSEIRAGLSGDGPAPTTAEIGGPDFAYQRMGMDAATRESYKQQILDAAIKNGEVQPDVTPTPTALPAPEYNQGELIELLLGDETGQLSMAFADDVVPVYDLPTGKSAELKLEEIRSRYDWAVLDNKARLAANQAYLKEKGWDKLTWEEKKQLGLVSWPREPQPYRQMGDENAFTYTGRLEPEVPGYSKFADLSDQVPEQVADVPAKAAVKRWTPQGLMPEAIAKKVDALRKPGKKRRRPYNDPYADQRTKREADRLDAARASRKEELQARLEKLQKQAQEGTCNG